VGHKEVALFLVSFQRVDLLSHSYIKRQNQEVCECVSIMTEVTVVAERLQRKKRAKKVVRNTIFDRSQPSTH